MKILLHFFILFFAAVVTLPPSITAQTRTNSDITVSRVIDWQQREVRFTLSALVDYRGLPSSRQRTEGWIDRERFRVIAESVSDLILDSQGSFNEDSNRLGQIEWNLDAAAAAAIRDHAALSSDFRSLEVVYRLSFHDIMRNIIIDTPQNVRPFLSAAPRNFEYSGIVIIASMELPIQNRFNARALLQPALAPVIMDEDGVTLLSLATLSPELFRSSSTIPSYTHEMNSQRWSPVQVGLNPFITTAVAVSGDRYMTNVVISRQDAERLRSSPRALETLRNGRVLIVIAPPQES